MYMYMYMYVHMHVSSQVCAIMTSYMYFHRNVVRYRLVLSIPANRYRLSSGNGDTSSSEDERYDRKEAKIYGSSSSASKTPETTAKMSATEGNHTDSQA